MPAIGVAPLTLDRSVQAAFLVPAAATALSGGRRTGA